MASGDDAASHSLDLVGMGHRHAGSPAGLHSDEVGNGRCPRHPFIGEQPYHLSPPAPQRRRR